MDFDDAVLQAFLDNQSKLYDRKVASTKEEANDYLLMVMAVVVDNKEGVKEFFEEEGTDLEGMSDEEILEIDEVFPVGDGRYLIVEG